VQRMGLSPADLRTYLHGLTLTHRRRIEVEVMTLDRRHVGSLTGRVLGGQAMGDADGATAPRTASLQVVDPAGVFGPDPRSSGTALHRSRLVQVTDSRYIPALGRWVECPVFTGPVWDYQRTGAQVQLELHGIESQAMGAIWHHMSWPAKTRKVRILRELAAACGLTRVRIPDLPATTPKRISVGREATYWQVMQRIAKSMDRDLFCDGAGVLILRRRPKRPCVTFDGRWLLAEPAQHPVGGDGLRNAVVVRGAKPSGKHKKRPHAVAVLPERHPNSPKSLAMDGRWLWLPEVIERGHAKTQKEVEAIARDRRDDLARTVTDYDVEVLPIPCLDEGDLVAVRWEGRRLLRVRQWGVPFTAAADASTVGAIKRTRGAA